jgi:hypothetical protein
MHSESSSKSILGLKSSCLEHTDFRNMLCGMLSFSNIAVIIRDDDLGGSLAALTDLAVGGDWDMKPL